MTDHRKQTKLMKLLRDTGQETEHYKMYKSGRNWLFASISLLTFGAGVALNQSAVKADDATMSDDTNSVATTDNEAASSSAVVLKSASTASTASDSAATSAAATSAGTNTDSSASDATSTDVESNSAASTAANEATAPATSDANTETSDNTTSATAASTANDASSNADTDKLAAIQTELPAGTKIETQSDGSTVIALPVGADIDLAKQIVEAAGLQNSVTITAKEADNTTAPVTYKGQVSGFNTTAYNKAIAKVIDNMGMPWTMADFAFITAVGTGVIPNGDGTYIRDATI